MERCYDNDYTNLSNELRELAFDYAMVRLQIAAEKGTVNTKSADFVYLLQLVANAVDRIGQQGSL